MAWKKHKVKLAISSSDNVVTIIGFDLYFLKHIFFSVLVVIIHSYLKNNV